MKKEELKKGFSRFVSSAERSQIDRIYSRVEEFAYLKLDQIIVPEKQIRDRVDESSFSFQSLCESIRLKGILEPLLVLKELRGYRLIAGFRRYQAAKEVGLKEVPVRILTDIGERDVVSIQLIENLVREGLSAVEIAEACKLYYEKNYPGRNLATDLFYYRRKPEALPEGAVDTIETLLKILGKKSRTISNIISLLTLPQEILQKIRKRELSTSAGYFLANYLKKHPEKKQELVELLNQRGFSLKELRQLLAV